MQIRPSWCNFQKQKSKLQISPPVVTLQGTLIERVKDFKYLDTIIDKNLGFKGLIS